MASFADTFDVAPDAPQRATCMRPGPMTTWLKALVGDSPCVELRGIGPGVKVSRWDVAETGLAPVIDAARRLSSRHEGVYYGINPLPAGLDHAATDADILARRWLFVDVDPVRPLRASSTNAEKQFAWMVMCGLRDRLATLGVAPDVVIDSGNGYHLYYPIDIPANDGGLVRRVLTALAALYDSDEVKIDTSVANASRVAKVPGTVSRKGQPTTDRPHRTSFVLECYSATTRLTALELTALAEALEVEAPAKPASSASPAKLSHDPDPRGEEWTPATRAAAYLEHVPGAVAGQRGHNQTLKTACNVGPGFGLTEGEALELLRTIYNPKCDPPWSDKDLARKVAEAYKRETRRGWLVSAGDGSRPSPPSSKSKGEGPAAVAPCNSPRKSRGPTFQAPNGVEETHDDERRLARLYVARHHDHPDRAGILYWKGDAYVWERGAWRIIDAGDLRARLTASTKTEYDRVAKASGEPVGHVGRSKIGDVENMLRSMMSLRMEQAVVEQPAWLGVPGPDPLECLNTRNGILHIPAYVESGSASLLPSTPNFFTSHVLDYEFDPTAPRPVAWLDFLESIWPGDDESKLALQQWFGYLLTPDTRQHAVLLMVGPPRCGKGTILRLVRQLIGEHNCVAPTLASLGGPFGSQCLIGKSLAYFGETRLSGHSDPQAIVERVLSISGEDQQTIQRKNLPDWTGVLPVRFVMLANALPSLGDRSGALMSRMRILKIDQSFVGREDRDLGTKLAAEIPSILLWALQGWASLKRMGSLIQPASGEAEREEMTALVNPVASFVADEIDFGRDLQATRAELFARWKLWCEEAGRDRIGLAQILFTGVREVAREKGFQVVESRPRIDGRPTRVLDGVGVRRRPAY